MSVLMLLPSKISLTVGKRVLFLTKDPDLIRRQIAGELDLLMADLDVADLLDDINTDVMTPAWVCFSYRPEDLARNAYAGLIVDGERLIPRDGLRDGNFEVIVSGYRKGVGSSRETAVQAEKWSGIRIAIAASFAPIHAANNVNQGVLMGDHAILKRLQAGEDVPLDEFCSGYDVLTQEKVRHGGLFAFSRALTSGEALVSPPTRKPRPMTMAEKILAAHSVDEVRFVRPGDSLVVNVDGGYSHEFTTAQVHYFLQQELGEEYVIPAPERFAVFEDHLIYADEVPKMSPFLGQIEELRRLQREFQRHSGVRDYSARDGVSPGICHEVARQKLVAPGHLILATDSHTCMGGCNNALTWGVGATEYANLVATGISTVEVPESIRFELVGELAEGVTAKDLMLYILLHYAKPQKTLNRVMEFGGPGLRSLSMDERATLTNMATECSARSAIAELDERTVDWLLERREGLERDDVLAGAVTPDEGASYAGGVFSVDLSQLEPMVAHPGDPDHGIPSDPTNGALLSELGEVEIDIAYGGSCTAGKIEDLEFYHRVVAEAVSAGKRVPSDVEFIIQFGSLEVERHCRHRGFMETFEAAGVRLIPPGCGACIGCGPGVSSSPEQVTVSAINRNYKGRSGPGRLYLASPLTVAASAFTGRITAYEPGMFSVAG
jgi:3-isopropylmalate/(R)-2-methylmalate dehydratase large subunit